jgi:hypothetical protein
MKKMFKNLLIVVLMLCVLVSCQSVKSHVWDGRYLASDKEPLVIVWLKTVEDTPIKYPYKKFILPHELMGLIEDLNVRSNKVRDKMENYSDNLLIFFLDRKTGEISLVDIPFEIVDGKLVTSYGCHKIRKFFLDKAPCENYYGTPPPINNLYQLR